MSPLPPPQRIALPERTSPRGVALAPITLSVHVDGEGPTLVLCHGFPELAYSWRKQFGALVEAGFRVIAPDMRGYGDSDRPAEIEAYDLEHLTGDLVRLLDHFEVERGIFAGHDWGGFVTWAMPIAWPGRVAGLIGVNTPYVPFPSTAVLRAVFDDDRKLYVLWFQEPGTAENAMDENPRLVFEKLMRGDLPPSMPGGLLGAAASTEDECPANPFARLGTLESAGAPLLDEAELDHYTRAFEKSGFRGGINWYRNVDRNAEAFPGIGNTPLALPCLMVTAEWDPAIPPRMAEGMPAVCPDLEMHMIERCGHWTQQEKPEELNAILLEWLRRRFGTRAEGRG